VPLDRRQFLLALAVAAIAMAADGVPVLAKDGGGDSSGSGSDGGGDSGSDSGDNDSSGSGSDGDDGDDGEDSDDGGDNSGNSGNSGRNRADEEDDADEDDALEAVRDGEIIPLSRAIDILRNTNEGRVIDVRLTRSAFRDIYAFKVKSSSGQVKTVRMDARNGRIVGF
jgi:uncharacterized membrane protein YkoI